MISIDVSTPLFAVSSSWVLVAVSSDVGVAQGVFTLALIAAAVLCGICGVGGSEGFSADCPGVCSTLIAGVLGLLFVAVVAWVLDTEVGFSAGARGFFASSQAWFFSLSRLGLFGFEPAPIVGGVLLSEAILA